MNGRSIFWCFLFFAAGIFSCTGKQKSFSGDSRMPLEHAAYLLIDTCRDYTMVQVVNPWDTTEILHRYVLVGKADGEDRAKRLLEKMPDATVVRVPLEKALVYSSVHCSLLEEFGVLDHIGGVCDLQYIHLPEIHRRCGNGKMMDAGNSMNPDMERIIAFRPDAIMLSPYENGGSYGRVEKLGVPIIECADYMEKSPLGRAEWMRFYGMLFGCVEKADSIYREVERKYTRLKEKAADVKERPTVLAELKSGSVWYVPGGKSTMGQLYQDAGADYIWKEDTRSGSFSLSFEEVYERGHDADFWLFKYNGTHDRTLTDLAAEYAPYKGFRAFRDRKVYGCNSGRVAFYEETSFHPERLLEDLMRIFHPEIAGQDTLCYFNRLEI